MIPQLAMAFRVSVDEVDRLVEFNPEIVVATCVQVPVRGELHKAIVLNFVRRLIRIHFVFARFSATFSVQIELVTLLAVCMPRDDIGVTHTGAIAKTEPRTVA